MGDETASRDESVTAVDTGTFRGGPAGIVAVRDVLAGRYEVRKVLGRGGMGVVVVAQDRTLGTEVAVKLLRPELAGERRWAERLAREVKLARQIHHANVCRVFDFVQADGRVFIVMELAVGTLRAELEAGTAVGRSVEDRLGDVVAVVTGLAAIHEAEIVHRDVTAQNILRLDDGRLAVSDFGLATDVGETTASIQGGTVAYMAPELGVGGRASFASDVWALGIVIHEIVFGRRPTWRGEEARRGIDGPGRKLSSIERAVFEICRACTAAAPAHRPRDAAAVARMLEKVAGHRARRLARVGAMVVFAAMVLVPGALGGSAVYRRWSGARQVALVGGDDSPIEITGVAADWTDSSRVLATVSGRIHCLVSLPDQHTVRFVWGLPKRAEDVDIHTGLRRPSPLVPKAYAEGCPDLSPDGRELIFQGFDRGGHPGIFRAPDPSGAGAVFSTSAANPSVLSEPKWFADGKAFVFDLDQRTFGVIDRASDRLRILPFQSPSPGPGWWRFVSGDRVFAVQNSPTDSMVASISWPDFREGPTFKIRPTSASWQAGVGGRLYATDFFASAFVIVDPVRRLARRVGMIRDRPIWLLASIGGGISFSTVKARFNLWIRNVHGTLAQATTDGTVVSAALCEGGEFLLGHLTDAGEASIDRLDVARSGGARRILSGQKMSPLCSRTGDDWWYLDFASAPVTTFMCREADCRPIAHDVLGQPSLSPDESRIAYVAFGNRGSHVRWMPSHGGPSHEVADTETNCRPGWSSNSTLWISRRRRGVILWTEVDAETGAPTGRTTPGGKDCADAGPDPLSPVDPDFRIVEESTSEVRWKDLGLAPQEVGTTGTPSDPE